MIAEHKTVDGVVIGMILGFRGAAPLVVFPGNPKEEAIPARSLARLAGEDVGAEVALLFEEGDRMRPLIVGKLVEPARDDAAPLVVADGQMLRLTAKERIELRVGRSSIVMEADGHITIRGTDLVSHAARSNRIRGGSVNLN
ncbi:hypothetical protein G5B31_12560 [Rhodobacter sp. SGA-6-6]|uniref:DUF6484 domain-containing protein n=1 Tax=Rhodobacter sp. SGA-6-6 TaxID=2710882 RepID=UPI0013EC1E0E|nr:DUF6484 domain-containing protein [Rhodobacter sp. SGA-6-6]NGM46368.1 hypothetical protein [Rhodobacter sp. SGA-6-6]